MDRVIILRNKMTENINSEVKYAGFGRRFLAYTTDGVIGFIIGMVIQTITGRNQLAEFLALNSMEEMSKWKASTSTTLTTLISFGVGLAYYMLFYVNYDGATPGKRLMGIKVVREDGTKLTYATVLVRYIGTIISGFIMCLGYLWIIWDERKQALHDKIARTLVVQTGAKPKTAIAVIIAIITICAYFGIMSLTVLKSLHLTGALNNIYKNAAARKELDKDMSPEVKALYDQSKNLFMEMKKVETEGDKIAPISKENIKTLQKAIDIDSQNAEIWFQLGNAYTWEYALGNKDAATKGVEAYKKANELAPNILMYMNGLGDMLVQTKNYDEAVLEYQKALRVNADSAYAHMGIAKAYVGIGINASAKEHYLKAIEIFTAQNSEGDFDSIILSAKKALANLEK